jgi:multidrug efflux pump subunit AcrA (membrane-fusion protein)
MNEQYSETVIQRGLFGLLLLTLTFGAACRSSKTGTDGGTPPGLIVINAPVTGEVRRVLVSEGVTVSEGTPILEIAVREGVVTPNTADPRAKAIESVRVASAEVTAAEDEVERASVEVQRVEPLVASGAAPQAQLDAARAQYQHAQERLQNLRSKQQNAQDNFVAQQGTDQPSARPAPSERIVPVRVPSAGNVRAISVRPGQHVTEGQPLATVSSN